MSAIADFLAAIQPPLHASEQIEARYIRQGSPVVRRYYSTINALIRDAHAMNPLYNVYVGVTVRDGHGGEAENCTRVGTLWGDFDAKLYAGAVDPLAATREALDRFPLPPGVVVCSGGGYHAYWLLLNPIDLRDGVARDRVERLNAALARAVCGPDRRPDHVQDVARILRVPDTVNHKTTPPMAVYTVGIHPERRYTLNDIEALLRDRYSWALHAAASPTPARTPSAWTPPRAPARGLLERAHQRMSSATRALLDGGTGHRQSGSEADMAVACALIGAGLTAAEALAVLLASQRATDHAARKGGNEGQERAYWQRTVTNAAAYVGPVVETTAGRVRTLPASRVPAAVVLPDAAARPLVVLPSGVGHVRAS